MIPEIGTINPLQMPAGSWERLSFQIANHCGPVLKGIKTANMVTGEAGAWKNLKSIFRSSGIICIPLYLSLEKDVLLLYRYELMKRMLENRDVGNFLKRFGYEETETASVIIRLRQRYLLYMEENGEFPHELGIMLGYPVEDVEGFILHGGKNCLLSGYWKVYGSKEKALKTFRSYDEARWEAIGDFLRGVPLEKIAVKGNESIFV